MKASNIITLTTDFGAADIYAGVMKGVILSINPACTIADITHDIPPQDIISGSFALASAYAYFPEGTIHLAVVDPGVGSSRRSILIETDRYFFVGPDNGIFGFVMASPAVQNVYELTNTAFFLPSPGTTFHGRDIFAPVAAHLSKGVEPHCFGNSVHDPVMLAFPEPSLNLAPEAEGEIIHIDRFGNLITNIRRNFFEKMIGSGQFLAELHGKSITKLLPNYADADEDELFCIFGSSGYLEISVKNKNAAAMHTVRRGDKIRLRRMSRETESVKREA